MGYKQMEGEGSFALKGSEDLPNGGRVDEGFVADGRESFLR